MVSGNPATHITQIKDGSVVKGNLQSQDSIRVDGHITGDLFSMEKIIVGPNGHIGGTLSGSDITVSGFVNGDIVSSGFLQISSAAKIYGKIFAKEISIEKGAEMNGKVNVCKDIELPEINSSLSSQNSKADIKSKRSLKVDQDQDKYGNIAW